MKTHDGDCEYEVYDCRYSEGFKESLVVVHNLGGFKVIIIIISLCSKLMNDADRFATVLRNIMFQDKAGTIIRKD